MQKSYLTGTNMNNKRLLLICQHFYPEMISTGMHMTELSGRLCELDWEITVYCAKPSWGINDQEQEGIPTEMVYEGIKIHRVWTFGNQQSSLIARGLFAITFFLSVCWQLSRHIKEFPAIMVTTNPPFIGLVGWLFTKLFKKPYLLLVYDVYPDIAVKLGVLPENGIITKIWSVITKLILNAAATIVVIGRDMDEIIRAKVKPTAQNRITLIPNWSDERLVEPVPVMENEFIRENNLEGKFVVQYAGRMGRTHNLEPLIEAANLIPDERIVFQFIGEGAKKATLQAFVENNNLQNVQFLPYQPMEILPQMLSSADIAVVCLDDSFTGLSVPSKSYGVMASGTPILGFLDSQGEIGRTIEELKCGIVMQSPGANEISEILDSLLNDPQKLLTMGLAGREGFLNKYTLAHAAKAYDKALLRTIEKTNETTVNFPGGSQFKQPNS